MEGEIANFAPTEQVTDLVETTMEENVDSGLKLARLIEIYHADLSNYERAQIEDNLDLFIIHMRRVKDFRACHDIASLTKKMVGLERHIIFPTA
uniref:Uncharacterized protein n=1 Tax=Hordeum vulgare subsp. vulgare TaxID=112509 RepID=A0A8I6YDF6_HORVV